MGDDGSATAAPVEFKGVTYKALADGKYDVIICGTGLKECILSGLLSVKGKKVRPSRRGESLFAGGAESSAEGIALLSSLPRFACAESESYERGRGGRTSLGGALAHTLVLILA